MQINYKQVVIWDANVIDVGFLGSEQSVPAALRGLACEGIYIVTGAPAAIAGQWIPGAMVINAVDSTVYIMSGTTASPAWTLVDTAAGLALAHNKIFVGNSSNLPAAVAVSGDLTVADTGAFTIANNAIIAAKIAAGAVTTTKILDANVTLAKLAAGITPSHIVKFAGKITWSGSGASLATTVAGVLSTDIVVASIQTAPTQAAYLVSAAPTTDTVTLVLSAANTSNNAVISYQVLRAAA